MSEGQSLGEIAYRRKRRGTDVIHYNYQKNGRCKITIPMPIAKQANIEPGTKVLIIWNPDTQQFIIRLVTNSDDLKYAYTTQNNNTEGLWRVYFTFKHYPNLRMPKASYKVLDYQINNGICFMLRADEELLQGHNKNEM